MAKKYENMTHEERCEYWAKEREKERAERQKVIDAMPKDMIQLIIDIADKAHRVVDTGGYGCNGGVRYLTAFDLQELEDVVDQVRTKFNIV
tara:strand:+ start:194 stop:466 length:273 start_codon:yes stop_codon:yes gene_type:complete